MTNEKTLYQQHPKMFRNRPVLFVLFVLLILAYFLGLLLLLVWWLRVLGQTLTVTDRRTILRKGILSKSLSEVRHGDVRNVQLHQTFFQRLFNVGSLQISSAGQSNFEIEVSGMYAPARIKEIIDSHR